MTKEKISRYFAAFLIAVIAVSFMPAMETYAAAKIKISKCTISLSQTHYTYNRKAKKPTVKVVYNGKKIKRKYYSLKYYKTKGPGTAKVKIRGKRKFKGSVTKKYYISKVKPTTVVSAAAPSVATSTPSAATPTATIESGSLAKPVASAISKGYRRIDVSWTNVGDAQGYYVQETNLSNGTVSTATINSGSQTSTSFYDKVTGASYKYTVQSFVNSTEGIMVSAWSNPVTATAVGTRIGHAKSGDPAYEPGDQNGNEVATGNWTYSSSSSSWKHWTYMARFNDPAKAEKCASLMADACNNNNIGYGKYPANLTMTNIAKTNGFNVAGIQSSCDTDCVCLVSVCINASIGKWTVSGLNPITTMTSKLSGLSNYLTVYSAPQYLTTDAYLQRGDILWTHTGNHTCIVQ